ncbi:MAG: hypothetical protein LBK66_05000 [Spirochaetaceae bacterium]|jgi:hypothetical protein|nr:hypothetical protein [Spirochaetaceae bacterium]
MNETGVFLCEKAIIDSRTNMASLINFYDGIIQPIGFPMVIPNITLVCFFDKGDDTQDVYEAEMSVSQNSKTIVPSMPSDINFQGGKFTRLILEFNGLILQNEGELTFDIKIKNPEYNIKKVLKILPSIKIQNGTV